VAALLPSRPPEPAGAGDLVVGVQDPESLTPEGAP
jgi:hypothetical protein